MTSNNEDAQSTHSLEQRAALLEKLREMRTSSRTYAAASSDEEMPIEEEGEKRSYNSLTYWDQRYQHHFKQQQQNGTADKSAAAAASSSSSSASTKVSKKRGRSTTSAASSTTTSSLDPAASSDDITSEWYYSYSDLYGILAPSLEDVDRSLSVLDIGCGISTLFEEIRASRTQELKSGGEKEEESSSKKSKSKKKKEEKEEKSASSKKKKNKAADDDDDEDDAPAPVTGLGFTGPCIGLDYSPTVIDHMRKAYPTASSSANKQQLQKNSNLHWICGDACYLLVDKELDEDGEDTVIMKAKKKSKKAVSSSESSSYIPPPLTPKEQELFKPGSFSLILDKATSDGMLCAANTALLTRLIYVNVARLLAPNGVYVIVSVNGPESDWFDDYVMPNLIDFGNFDDGRDYQWQVEVHTPSTYHDGEEEAPNVYIIKKAVCSFRRSARATTQAQREVFTLNHTHY